MPHSTDCHHCGRTLPSPVEIRAQIGEYSYCSHCENSLITCAECCAYIDPALDPVARGLRGYCCQDCRPRFHCSECETEVGEYDYYESAAGEVIYLCNECEVNATFDCSICESRGLIDEAQDGVCRVCASRGNWEDKGFYCESPSYNEIRSRRKFGVEFETSTCPNHSSVRGDTVFGCKEDGSVDGMEFVSPVLYGDEGLNEIRKLCRYARRLNWEVDTACGYHVHLDMSDESDENCFRVAFAYYYTYNLWSRFISNTRRKNYYCARHSFNFNSLARATDFTDWAESAMSGERYNWVNWDAYMKHKTVEIRSHTPTLNYEKASNWIKAHARFIDKVVTMSRSRITQELAGRSVYAQFKTVSEWWDDSRLTEFYRERAAYFGNPIISDENVMFCV